ncbi:hypothetical protein UlMin_040766 [Ulmus minor]
MEKLYCLIVLIVVASSSSSISSSSLPAIFSFGDSILDAGNNRFSNNCISINQSLVQNSILLFESGSNDILTLVSEAYVQAMLTKVSNFIDQLHKHGAPALAVISLGPVSCVPARARLPGALVDQCCGDMNKMVENYNQGLESLVKDIPVKYPGMVAAYGAVYDIVQQFRAIPTLYGASFNAQKGYKVCQKPNEFLATHLKLGLLILRPWPTLPSLLILMSDQLIFTIDLIINASLY